MCVAVLKPAGADVPSLEILKKCWESNPDGAGLAISEDESVYYRKGFMTFSALEAFYNANNVGDRVSQAIAFHFRVGTHGLKDGGNTHPFPVSEDASVLRALEGRAPVMIAHNGVFSIPISIKDVSDTGQFIANCAKTEAKDPVAYWSEHATVTRNSRMIVIKPGNRFTLLGDWHSSEKANGCFFSNTYWNRTSYVVDDDNRGYRGNYAYGTGAGWTGNTYHGGSGHTPAGRGFYTSKVGDDGKASLTKFAKWWNDKYAASGETPKVSAEYWERKAREYAAEMAAESEKKGEPKTLLLPDGSPITSGGGERIPRALSTADNVERRTLTKAEKRRLRSILAHKWYAGTK